MPEFRRSRALIVGAVLALIVAFFSVDYTVERGDTLGRIARDNNVSVSDLIKVNDIENPNLIYPGQVLTIPGEKGRADITHIVARGETLNRIAAKYKASVSKIVAANSISNPNLILIGQRLVIPSGAGSGSGRGSGPAETDSSPTSDRTGKYHVVKRGESVASIAAQYSGVSVDDIVRANGIVNGVIYASTALYLDGPGYIAKGTSGSTSYTVKAGDRLGDIAHRFGVSLSTLVETNGIADPNLIRKGQKLSIPSGSQWVCPVSGASYFNDWGFPRDGGARYHEGNDLFLTRGSPVRAPVGGTVEFITGTVGGLQFRLVGKDGITYIGSHMDEFGSEGKVNAGDVIGYVGDTGNAKGTRPHLHFGMYYKGITVNPYPSLAKFGC